MNWLKRLALATSALVLVGSGVVVAQAATTSTSPKQFSACLDLKTKTLTNVSFSSSAKCAAHTTPVSWNSRGPAGAKGTTGPRGPQGIPGPSSLTSLQGKPCTFGGSYASTTAVAIDPITGLASITCTPVY